MEKPWKHSTMVHAKMTGHNHAKSLAGLSVTNLLRPTEVNPLLPPLSGTGSIAKDVAQRQHPGLWRLASCRRNLGIHASCQQSYAPILHPFALACLRQDDSTRPTLVWIAGAGWDAPTNPTISATTINVRASGRASPLFWRFSPVLG